MESVIHIERIKGQDWAAFSDDLKNLCQSSETDDSPAAVNYHWKDWQDRPASLMYVLAVEGRYDHGFLDLLYQDGVLVAVSGCYAADWNPAVLVMGSRAYTRVDRRGQDWYHGEHLFPRQWDHAVENGYRAAVISFNDYNDRLLRFFRLAAKGRFKSTMIPNFYRSWQILPDRYLIKHTAQNLVAKLIDDATWAEFESSLAPPRA